MGDLINVIAKFNEIVGKESFLEKVKLPALKLVGLYVAQVSYLSVTLKIKFFDDSEILI